MEKLILYNILDYGTKKIVYVLRIFKEIYEYVNAYNSLIFSANGNLIKNPTLSDVWFVADGKMYKISSGELLNVE